MHTFARGREPSGAPMKRSRGISRHVVALGGDVGRDAVSWSGGERRRIVVSGRSVRKGW